MKPWDSLKKMLRSLNSFYQSELFVYLCVVKSKYDDNNKSRRRYEKDYVHDAAVDGSGADQCLFQR